MYFLTLVLEALSTTSSPDPPVTGIRPTGKIPDKKVNIHSIASLKLSICSIKMVLELLQRRRYLYLRLEPAPQSTPMGRRRQVQPRKMAFRRA